MKSRAVSAPYRSISDGGLDDVPLRLGHLHRPPDVDRLAALAALPFFVDLLRVPPAVLGALGGLHADHPLGKEALERLVSRGQPLVAEILVEEAGVDEVHAGVLHPSHVLVHGREPAHLFRVERRAVVLRVDVPQEVPGGLDEGVERVGLPPAGLPAGGARHAEPMLRAGQRVPPLPRVRKVLRKHHRKVLLRNGNDAARLAVDHRDRTTPVPLPADAPVAKTVLDRPAAHPLPFKVKRDRLLPLFARDPVERAGADQAPRPLVRRGHRRRIERLPLGLHDDRDRQAVLAGELEVALVVGRHRHHRAGAVVVQDEVGGVDRDPVPRGGVHAIPPGEHPLLHEVLARPGDPVLARDPVDELPHLALPAGPFRELHHHRVLGGHAHEGGAEERVGPRREHRDVAAPPVEGEADLRPLAAADPVALHLEDVRRPPALELPVPGEQLLGVLRDADEPLVELLLGHRRLVVDEARPVAVHLLVGEHGLALSAPVERGALAVREAVPEHPQEKELLPLVIFRGTGRELAVPVVGDPHLLQLAPA